MHQALVLDDVAQGIAVGCRHGQRAEPHDTQQDQAERPD
jgi:hypothetical protein